LRPAVALVNDLRVGPGARAGQFATTGTFAGLNVARPEQTVIAEVAGFGVAEVRFLA
jgi:hypothetical protein